MIRCVPVDYVEKFSAIISSKRLSITFPLSSSSGTPIIRILFLLDWSHSSINVVSFLEILLSLSMSGRRSQK